MLSDFAAAGALVVALIIGLGRQVTVFTVFEPGLWLFRSYRRKRNLGLLLTVASVARLFASQAFYLTQICANRSSPPTW